MNTIHSSSVQGRESGKGFGLRLAAIALGAAFFLSATGSEALAQSAKMTQLEYLQVIVKLSGEKLGKQASANDYVVWAKARGMNPVGGWKAGDKLSKQVVAETLAQLLGIMPRKKGGADYVSLLAQNGIQLPTQDELSRADVFGVFSSGQPLLVPAIAQSPIHPGQVGHGDNGNGADNGKGHEHHDHDGDGFPDNPFPGKGHGGPHSRGR